MNAESCPHPEELQRLIEERLGPVREAEIEVHVEACPICQDQLERLTARRAWDKDDRDTHEASSSDGIAPDVAETGAFGGTTDLIREILLGS
jgi:hypothetical protein